MSRRRYDLRSAAAGAATGRRIVLSVGSIDGVLLAALRKVQTAAGSASATSASAWGPGVQVETSSDGTNEVD